MFSQADSFNRGIGSWNVSGGTDFVSVASNRCMSTYLIDSMFTCILTDKLCILYLLLSFYWTFKAYMFAFSDAFNQEIGSWDVSNGKNFVRLTMSSNLWIVLHFFYWHVTHISLSAFLHTSDCRQRSMFDNADSFNQNIGSWDVRNGNNFVSVTNNYSLLYFHMCV